MSKVETNRFGNIEMEEVILYELRNANTMHRVSI